MLALFTFALLVVLEASFSAAFTCIAPVSYTHLDVYKRQQLGNPAKKEQSVKPAGASGYLGRVGADEKNSKRVNVEMWYYKDLVNYDPKNKYKETEITFVNDRVMNIAFFNNR